MILTLATALTALLLASLAASLTWGALYLTRITPEKR